MAREIFVDASAWIALADPDDNHHPAASRVYPRLLTDYHQLVTTNVIVSEVYVALRRGPGVNAALEFTTLVRTSRRISRIFSEPHIELTAETILRQYADHDFSYVDAISFALMRERKISEAFTFDHHFAVMGFRIFP